MPSRSLCLIVPKEHWSQLQAIRRDHDKEFLNIPPHINLLFPLRGRGQSDDQVAQRVRSLLADTAPFEITCSTENVTYFPQSDHCVAHVRVKSNGVLERLHEMLAEEYPLPPRPVKDTYNYVPHATLGGLSYKEIDRKIEEWKSQFQTFKFTATFVALLTQTKGERFFIRRLIDIGANHQSDQKHLEEEKESIIEVYDPREHNIDKVREWISSEVSSIYQQTRPSPSIRRARTTAVRLLSQAGALQGRVLHEFGSSASGLDRHDGDLDLLIGLQKGGEQEEAIPILEALAQELSDFDPELSVGADFTNFSIVEEVFDANVPRLILNFNDKGTTNIPIDVTVEDISDPFLLERPKELRRICAKDKRIRPYLIFVKEWAKSMKLCNSVEGTINGYGWVFIGVFVLRHDYGAELVIPPEVSLADMVVSFHKQLNIFCENRGKLAMDVATGQYVANVKFYSFYIMDAHLKTQNLAHCVREKTASRIYETAKNSWSLLQRRMQKRVATTQTTAVLSYARDWTEKESVVSDDPIIRVLQMNVLADALVTNPEPEVEVEESEEGGEHKDEQIDEIKQEEKYEDTNELSEEAGTDSYKCNTNYLSWEYRAPLILRELTIEDPDIICIEECDHFDDFYRPELSERGYQCVFKRKRPFGGRVPRDGCAIFYRASKFISVARHDIILRTFPGAPSMHIALVLQLQFVTDASKKFYVCVTHLKSGGRQWGEDIRLKQMTSLLTELEDLCEGDDLILCADLNSTPRPRSEKAIAKVYPFIIQHPLYIRSAYSNGSDPFMNPPFTHWPGWIDKTKEVKATIDYIFHSKNFRSVSVLEPPTEGVIVEERLPNKQHPSDHIAIVADLQLRSSSQAKDLKGGSSKTSQQQGGSLRTSWDVYNRLKWDKELPYDIADVFIGYRDTRRGDSELAFSSFLPIADGGDIPFHHIFYFRTSHELLWDRRTRLDQIFGSGNPVGGDIQQP